MGESSKPRLCVDVSADVAVVSLHGEFEHADVPELASAITRAIDHRANQLTIDLGEATFLCVQAIASIGFARFKVHSLVLRNAPALVIRILEIDYLLDGIVLEEPIGRASPSSLSQSSTSVVAPADNDFSVGQFDNGT